MSIKSWNLVFLLFLAGCASQAPMPVATKLQTENNTSYVQDVYQKSYTKYFDLVHTRLELNPLWKEKAMNGQAAIILRPHFYPTDSLVLDAKRMDVFEVALLSSGNKKTPLSYTYDSLQLHIALGRTYTRDESLTIFIRYKSNPERLPSGGGEAIRSEKGLYFIDVDSTDENRPTQFWTQGETESNSAWFPTIEDPGQRMTQEIYLTVDTAMTTLSNGLLISTTNNNDGTKTDYWKSSLPSAPYLSMIAAGNYAVVRERWKNIEVSYYVDPPALLQRPGRSLCLGKVFADRRARLRIRRDGKHDCRGSRNEHAAGPA